MGVFGVGVLFGGDGVPAVVEQFAVAGRADPCAEDFVYRGDPQVGLLRFDQRFAIRAVCGAWVVKLVGVVLPEANRAEVVRAGCGQRSMPAAWARVLKINHQMIIADLLALGVQKPDVWPPVRSPIGLWLAGRCGGVGVVDMVAPTEADVAAGLRRLGCAVSAVARPRNLLCPDAPRELAVLDAAGVEDSLLVAAHELDAPGTAFDMGQAEDLGARLGPELQDVAGPELLGGDLNRRHGGEGTTGVAVGVSSRNVAAVGRSLGRRVVGGLVAGAPAASRW